MHGKTDHSVLKVLTYFDLFDYPLSKEEISFYLDHPLSDTQLSVVLQQLSDEGQIFLHQGFYSLQDKPALTARRKDGNNRAQTLLETGYRVAAFLYRFPYVRGVCISGSLSKNFADEKADIDFFIITHTNRLWIARTLMHLFKKLTFLVGRQHWYCMNYYIDEAALQIEERNVFTATEMITLLPVCGNGALDNFFEANSWTKLFYPKYTGRQAILPGNHHRYRTKRWVEWLFNNSMGDRLDNYLMKITAGRWKKKEAEKRLNMRGGRMGLKTGKHFCKPNPVFFQHQILERYRQRLAQVEASMRFCKEMI